MSKRRNDIESLLNEFREDQIKFKEEQRAYNEKQNKKNRKIIIIMMFVCLFISGITSVLSYTLGASSVEYTPRDSSWNVENAQEAIDNLFDSVGSSLVGSVYSYMGVITPPGYLACDGSIYNIEDYPRLANHINVNFGSVNYFGGDGVATFAVPDLRGEFLRGTGTNSHTNQGSGLTVGTHQDATIHGLAATDNSWGAWVLNNSKLNNSWDYHINAEGVGYAQQGLSATNDNNRATWYTSRPTNTAVLYIIKY